MADLIIEVAKGRVRVIKQPRPRKPWHPHSLPPPGFELEVGGSVFECISVKANKDRRRRGLLVIRWRTQCMDCGKTLYSVSSTTTWQELRARRCMPCQVAAIEAEGPPTGWR